MADNWQDRIQKKLISRIKVGGIKGYFPVKLVNRALVDVFRSDEFIEDWIGWN